MEKVLIRVWNYLIWCRHWINYSKGGAWYTFNTLDDNPKFQGAEKARDFLMDNPEVYKASLSKEIKEALGI
jgi:hypothetical protein